MSGIFEGDVFGGPRRGMYGAGALGLLPEGAAQVSTLSRWRGQFPGLPSQQTLSSKGATHYTTRVVGPTSQEFTFYDSTGRTVVGPFTIWRSGAERPVEPTPEKAADAAAPSPMARREDDGLLPSAPRRQPSEPNWLPWLLLGGGVLVAGGIVFAVTRKPKTVAANRRRRRRTRRRRR